MKNTPRAFTLLITMILVSVILSVSFALLDIAYKQVYLTSISTQSQVAFYNADSGLECALYWDQQQDEFDFSSEPLSGTISCEGQTIGFAAGAGVTARTTTFTIPCAGDGASGDGNASIIIYKQPTGATAMYSNGFNTCKAADPRRVERGLKTSY
jgi:hypothetical protein